MLFYFLALLVIVFGLIVEGATSLFFPGNILPDLTLILVVGMGFLLGERQGAVVGLVAGLLEDVMFGQALGFFALSKMMLGLGAGLAGKEIYREKAMGPVVLVFAGTLIHGIILYMLQYLYIGTEISLEAKITSVFLPRALFNAFLTVPVYSLVHWLFERKNPMGWKIHF